MFDMTNFLFELLDGKLLLLMNLMILF